MSINKKVDKSSSAPSKAKVARRTPSDLSQGGQVTRTNDVIAAQAEAVNSLAAAMPFNAAKPSEYGQDNALAPPRGAAVAPASAALTASTQSENNVNAKTGGAAVPGINATIAPLQRVRADAGGQPLTTNQGVAVADN